jgi:pilus assembly protein Flp/PilA
MRICAMIDFWFFLRDEDGATSIEYALIAGGIALVIIAAVNSVGSTLNAKFTEIESKLP